MTAYTAGYLSLEAPGFGQNDHLEYLPRLPHH